MDCPDPIACAARYDELCRRLEAIKTDISRHDKQAGTILERVSGQHDDLGEIKKVVLETANIQREQAVLGKLSEERMAKNDERMFRVTMRMVYLVGGVLSALLAFFFGGSYLGIGF